MYTYLRLCSGYYTINGVPIPLSIHHIKSKSNPLDCDVFKVGYLYYQLPLDTYVEFGVVWEYYI